LRLYSYAVKLLRAMVEVYMDILYIQSDDTYMVLTSAVGVTPELAPRLELGVT
jgi:hypothetical protein